LPPFGQLTFKNCTHHCPLKLRVWGAELFVEQVPFRTAMLPAPEPPMVGGVNSLGNPNDTIWLLNPPFAW
jgi:hypothetical protein